MALERTKRESTKKSSDFANDVSLPKKRENRNRRKQNTKKEQKFFNDLNTIFDIALEDHLQVSLFYISYIILHDKIIYFMIIF
jgi:hypothetical protein